MRPSLILLALLTILCTRGRAQVNVESQSLTSLALIKNTAEPFPADSFTLRTSLDTVPYGFAFNQDTLLLDVNIFPPIDELTVELWSGTTSFGRFAFWVDAPSANVHLSVKDDRTEVDSVTLSGVDTWFREQLKDLRESKGLLSLSRKLMELSFMTSQDLMGATFAAALVDLPSVSSGQLYALREDVLGNLPFLMRQHPRYKALKERTRLIGRKPANFGRLGFYSTSGKPVKIKLPEQSDFFVLDLYSADNPAAQRAHREIRDRPKLDSLFTTVTPLISISNDPSPALWRLYVQDNNFGWHHFIEDPAQAAPLSAEIALDRRPLYLLLNRKQRVVGVYYTLQSLTNAVHWQTRK